MLKQTFRTIQLIFISCLACLSCKATGICEHVNNIMCGPYNHCNIQWFSHSLFKYYCLFQVNLWTVGRWNDCQPTLWQTLLRRRRQRYSLLLDCRSTQNIKDKRGMNIIKSHVVTNWWSFGDPSSPKVTHQLVTNNPCTFLICRAVLRTHCPSFAALWGFADDSTHARISLYHIVCIYIYIYIYITCIHICIHIHIARWPPPAGETCWRAQPNSKGWRTDRQTSINIIIIIIIIITMCSIMRSSSSSSTTTTTTTIIIIIIIIIVSIIPVSLKQTHSSCASPRPAVQQQKRLSGPWSGALKADTGVCEKNLSRTAWPSDAAVGSRHLLFAGGCAALSIERLYMPAHARVLTTEPGNQDDHKQATRASPPRLLYIYIYTCNNNTYIYIYISYNI